MYYPICFYSIARRERSVSPDTIYDPLIIPADLIAQTPVGGIAFFGWCCEPVNDPSEAQYVVYPNTMAPPPGFQWFAGEPPQSNFNDWYENMEAVKTALYAPSPSSSQCQTPVFQPSTVTPDPIQNKPEEAEEKLTLAETPTGYFIISSKTNRKSRASNYLIQELFEVHRLKYGSDSEKRFVQLTLQIVSSTRTQALIEVSIDEIDSIGTKIGKKVGTAIAYPGVKPSFFSQLSLLVRERLAYCQHKYIYGSSGWVLAPQGTWMYVQDGAKPPFPNISFRSGFGFGKSNALRTTDWLVRNAWRLLSLSQNSPAAILIPFLFAHMALLWTLFEKAGYPPHVLLFIKGTTGSLKTAVASLLFNFSGVAENNIPASFRDTSASMEVQMAKYRDRVLLVDDFCPAASENARKILGQNLEQLVRFFGDGIAKRRTDPKLEEIFEIKPHGLCAITGEDSSGSYSSQLRCLFITVKPDTYDKALLAEFQADPTLWTEYLSHFVNYCVDNASQLINLIQTRFQTIRNRAGEVIQEGRLIDTYVELRLTAEILLNFAGNSLQLFGTDLENLLNQFDMTILETCKRSAEEAKATDPAKIFARLLSEGIDSRTVVIATRDEFELSPNKFYGYVDGDYWYFWRSKLYSYIQRAYLLEDRQFPLTQTRLWESLCAAKILVPSASRESCVKKFEYGVRVSFGNRPRLIRIDKTMLSQFL